MLTLVFGVSGCLEIPTTELEMTTSGPKLLDRCQRIPIQDRKGLLGGLASTFTLLNWNIQKTIQPGWQAMLEQQAVKADVVLLQESVDSAAMQSWLQQHEHAWQQVIAFRYEGQGAGVMTASQQADVYSCSARFPEPTTRIPKSTLVSLFPLQGSRYPLLIVNVHAVNVELGMASYRDQIKRIGQWVRKYPGPVVVAGDFNTWSERRMSLLQQQMSRLGMSAVAWQPDQRSLVRNLPLDHIFYRGLKVQSSTVERTTASDHHPMQVTFSL